MSRKKPGTKPSSKPSTKPKDLERRIHDAILLACDDVEAADRELMAVHALAMAAKNHPALVACLKVLSVITAGQIERRAAICRELVKHDPDNVSNIILLAEAEAAGGDAEAAELLYESALDLAKDPAIHELVRDSIARLKKKP